VAVSSEPDEDGPEQKRDVARHRYRTSAALVAIDEATVPRLYLDLEQPLERPGDLPFLIARGSVRHRAGFADKVYSGSDQTIDVENVLVLKHGNSRCRAGVQKLSVTDKSQRQGGELRRDGITLDALYGRESTNSN
jgi:hypothetical protein